MSPIFKTKHIQFYVYEIVKGSNTPTVRLVTMKKKLKVDPCDDTRIIGQDKWTLEEEGNDDANSIATNLSEQLLYAYPSVCHAT